MRCWSSSQAVVSSPEIGTLAHGSGSAAHVRELFFSDAAPVPVYLLSRLDVHAPQSAAAAVWLGSGQVFRAQLAGSSAAAIEWLHSLPGEVRAVYRQPRRRSPSFDAVTRPRDTKH